MSTRSRISRALALAAALLLLCGGLLAACGSDDDGGSSTAAGSGGDGGAKSVKIAAQAQVSSLSFAVIERQGMEAAAKDVNAELLYSAPDAFDSALAQKQATDLLTQRPDGFLVIPYPPELWQRTMRTIVEQVPNTVAADVPQAATADDLGSSPIRTFVGINDTEMARAMAAEVIKRGRLGRDATGTALLGQCLQGESGVIYERIQGFTEVVERELPNVKVRVFDSRIDPAGNRNAWESAVASTKDLTLSLGACDPDGPSIARVKEATRGSWPAGTLEDDPATLRAVRDGTLQAVAAVNRYAEGYIPVRLLADAARDEQELPEGFVDAGFTVIVSENAEEIITRNSSPEETQKWYEPKIERFFAEFDRHVHPMEDRYK
jgi:ABC-type sugar transport system substrate-binding protein